MTTAAKTLGQMKRANKLTRLAFRKNGPKSYKRGQGALLKALAENGCATQCELVKKLGMSRGQLKDIVRKAQRHGYVTIENTEEKHVYTVKLTEDGRTIIDKRIAANEKTAEDILGALTLEEQEQLNAITEKLIVSLKEKGISGKGRGRKFHRHCKRHHCRCH